jgi:hypothetical protein
MRLITPKNTSRSARIMSSQDPLRMTIWAADIILAVIAAALQAGCFSRRSHRRAVRDPGRDHPRLGARRPAGRVPDPGQRAHPGPRRQSDLRGRRSRARGSADLTGLAATRMRRSGWAHPVAGYLLAYYAASDGREILAGSADRGRALPGNWPGLIRPGSMRGRACRLCGRARS